MTVFLAGSEGSSRWLASGMLAKTGGPQVAASVKVLLALDISAETREEAENVLAFVAGQV